MHVQLSLNAPPLDVTSAGPPAWRSLLPDLTRRLSAICGQPAQEAQWLITGISGLDPARWLADADLAPTIVQFERFQQAVERRVAGEPLAYITGEQPFWRYSFAVSPDVLIPRPETEHLVEWALELVDAVKGQVRVLDACTGSGCVALSIALDRPASEVWAADISPAALIVARCNGERLGRHVHWLQADALAFSAPVPPMDLIVANPPYIAEQDPHLGALQHEPTLALVSGADGLALIRRLIAQAPGHLLPGGTLLLEHGYDQAKAVRDLFVEAGWTSVQTRRDYGGRERVTGARWHG